MVTGVIKNKVDKIWDNMADAMFLIPSPQVLLKVITGLDDLYENDVTDAGMQGDLYDAKKTAVRLAKKVRMR